MFKSGFITIAGRPNVGKSTLMNALLGEKIAAISPKPQTTRTRITGIVTKEDAQLVFVDTPGIHKSKNKLGTFMNKTVRQSVSDADIILYMVDASKYNLETDSVILEGLQAPVMFLLINKTDKVDKAELLPIIDRYSKVKEFNEILPMSALAGEGLDVLVETVKKYLPEGPKFFPDDVVTDQPDYQVCAEMIREKMMRYLSDEIPYGTAVTVERMDFDQEKNLTSISASIYCERESHKGIIIGKKGEMLKKIGSLARSDIQRFTGTKVFLELWVKVRENWRNNEIQLKNFGYKEDNY